LNGIIEGGLNHDLPVINGLTSDKCWLVYDCRGLFYPKSIQYIYIYVGIIGLFVEFLWEFYRIVMVGYLMNQLGC
jgi:hypothetical protein